MALPQLPQSPELICESWIMAILAIPAILAFH